MRERQITILLSVLALMCAGCESSTRTMRLGSRSLELKAPIEITHEGIPVAGSPNGEYFVEWRELSKGHGVVEVRDYATKSLRTSIPTSDEGPMPVMFDAASENLLCFCGKQAQDLYAYRVSDGTRTKIASSPVSMNDLIGGARNADGTIVATGLGKPGPVLTAGGVVRLAQGKVRFDSDGKAWFQTGAGWTVIDKTGMALSASHAPSGLVEDQSHARGSLRLVASKEEIKHRDAEAFVWTIWLEDASGGKVQAAFVHSCPDLLFYGFVPGREAVYCVTQVGSCIVPYEVKGAQTGAPVGR